MTDYFDVNNEELLKDFFSEAEQQVETFESNILVIENDPTNRESLDEIFRAAHTLKGGSATVEMHELSGFTHAVEDVLDALRSDLVKITEEIIDILLSSIDIIKAMLQMRSNGSVYEEDVEPIKNRLRSFIPGKEKKSSAGAKKAEAPKASVASAKPAGASDGVLKSPATYLSEYDLLELKELCTNGQELWGVTVVFDESNPMNTVGGVQVFSVLKKCGNVLKTVPDFDELYEDAFHKQVVYYVASDLPAEKIEDNAFLTDVVLAVDAQKVDEAKDVELHIEESSAQVVPDSFPSPATHLSESELYELQEMCSQGEQLWGVTVVFDESNPMNTVGGIQVFVALKEKGHVLKSIPDFDTLYDDEFYPQVVYYVSTVLKGDDLEDAAFLDDVVLAVDAQSVGEGAKGSASAEVAEVKPASVPDAPAADKPAEAKGATGAQAQKAATPTPAVANAGSVLRVDAKRIDYLLNLVSETVIVKAAFNQTMTTASDLQTELQTLNTDYKAQMRKLLEQLPRYMERVESGESMKDVKIAINKEFGSLNSLFDKFEGDIKGFTGKFRSYTQNLGRIAGELQEGVMKIRMVPISQIFSRFPRVVRDLSRDLNKKINLVIEGEDTELDKSVVEDLLDPIMHCVRNSMDHGIEQPNDRLKAGKREEGKLLLKASNEGNMIAITIEDDGKGIDVDSVRAKAIERGLIHPTKTISDEEAFQFIFDPGFSTAKKITSVSGRGVGLDVVRTQIEKLKGNVVVNSEKGVGTKFSIRLPLTLAIIQGLLVRVGSEVYSIPVASVIESQRIRMDELNRIDNYEVLTVRNEVISVLRLNRLFGIKNTDQSDFAFIVIVGTADKKLGIMVDALIGEEDVVIKPLTDQFAVSPGIAGASILGDGSVSLIIDVSQLLALGIKLELMAREERHYG
ncbi:MAG: chemotaxis protein CheW [Spirochaetales bacterium]